MLFSLPLRLSKQARGLSAFVVDANNPGLVVKKRTQVISPHPIGMIAFEECVVPENSLLGNQGDGLKIALVTLDLFRCTVAAAAVGLAQRATEEALITAGSGVSSIDR